MDEVLLSICIPTYNRASYLRGLLNSIISQIVPFDYEVHITDNASTDTTEDVAKSFCDQHANFFYAKNEVNLGGIVNIRKCTEAAKGKFMLLVGDDDIFVDGAFALIKNVINITHNQHISAILFNHKLPSYFDSCKKFDNGFEWLKYMRINEPAFLPAVLWSNTFWGKFDYYENIKSFFLPQLHCFINACHENQTYGLSNELVVKGKEIDTGAKSYWFYKFHALVDCFEYPYLYSSVLNNKKIDRNTRLAIIKNEVKLIKEIFKKIAFIRNHQDDYAEYIPKLKNAYDGKFYKPLLSIYINILFNTSFGEKIAKKIVS